MGVVDVDGATVVVVVVVGNGVNPLLLKNLSNASLRTLYSRRLCGAEIKMKT